MKYFALSITALFAVIYSAMAAVEIGAKASEFTLEDTTGQTHSLTDFKGNYVVLEWTNHQCPFVVKHYVKGHMQAAQKELTDDGVVWLQVVSSAEGKQGYVTAAEGERLRGELAMHSTATLLDADGSVGKAYDARTTPHMYLIDPDGTLIYQGAIDSIRSTRASDIEKAINYIKAAYANAKAGAPIDPATTKPYGCSVKY